MDHSAATPRNTLEVLAEEFATRIRSGEAPQIEEYTAQHPELEREVRDLFPTIEALEQLRQEKRAESGSGSRLAIPRLERLGDLRIVREIGRGGMGVVYEAVQESLGRRVAVKVLPKQALLDSQQLRRFEREARTAANLHHTNIVPVLGVGEHDGYHFYVMQYIDGIGVDEVIARLRSHGDVGAGTRLSSCYIRGGHDASADTVGFSKDDLNTDADAELSFELPTIGAQDAHDSVSGNGRPSLGTLSRAGNYWTDVATIGHQVACALQYAHQHGTLHRDVKPGNLILDSEGTVWVADFGLAKAGEQDGVTRSGDIVGTLKYMAPEQLRGEADARSDVYGLGLTLYELLTLRSVHQDRDRKQSLVHSTPRAAVVRPRSINPGIPADLETIALTAMAEDPGGRYATAGDLAADLQRFLEQRPIVARRITAAGRLLRWARRNPAVASLSAVAVSLLVLVAVVASIGYWRTDVALRSESAQRQRAESTLEVSLTALDTIFRRYVPQTSLEPVELELEETSADVELPATPVLSQEAADMLASMLDFYDRLAELNAEDESLRQHAALANRRLGYIHERLGRYEEARAAFDKAIERYQQLARDHADAGLFAFEVARIRNQKSEVLRRLLDNDEAEQECRLAMTELEQLLSQNPTPEARYELANSHYLLGKSHRRRGTPRGRRGSPRRRDRGDEPGPPPRGSVAAPDGPPPQRGGPPRRAEGPPPPWRPRDWQQRDRHLDEAIEILSALSARHANVPEYRRLLALCYRERRDPESAQRDAAQALDILGRLVAQYPTIEEYRHDLCETYIKVSMQRMSNEADRDRLEQLREAAEIAKTLNWNVPAYRITAMRLQLFRGMLLQRLLAAANGDGAIEAKHRDEAITCFENGLAIAAELPRREDAEDFYTTWRALGIQLPLAQLLVARGQTGDLGRARELLTAAQTQLEGSDPELLQRRMIRDRRAQIEALLEQLRSEDPAAREVSQPPVGRPPL